nr:MAG TPA: hypothetical protein [Caudoviricetes sp.]
MVENQILFYFFKQSVHHRHLHSLRRLHLKQLNSFGQDDLAVNTLGSHIANLTVGSVQFVQALHGTAGTVTDPVVLEVTKGNGESARLGNRNIRRGVDFVAEQTVGNTSLNGRLPEVLTVLILQLAEQSHSRIVHEELCVLAVRSLQSVNQADNLVHGDCSSGRCGNTHSTAVLSKDAGGLSSSVAYAESLFLGNTKSTGKFLAQISLDVESAVLEQFHADTAEVSQLVSINLLLTEGRIALGISGVLSCPLRHGMTQGNRNLTLVVGSDHLCQTANDVLLVQSLYDVTLELQGHKKTTVLIGSGGQHIVNQCLATKVKTEVLLIGIGCTAHTVCLGSSGRFFGDGAVDWLAEFSLMRITALLTANLIGEGFKFLLHVGIDSIVLRGQNAHVIAVGVQETFHSSPQLGALFTHFNDIHIHFLLNYRNFLMVWSRALSSSTLRPLGLDSCLGFAFAEILLMSAFSMVLPENA